jgi:ketosteroid isomerase-like protein
MKKLAFLTILLAFSLSAYSQGSFNEKTFYDLMAKNEDPNFLLENTHEKFLFITGNGAKMNRSEFVNAISTVTVKSDFSDMTVNQAGGTALVSGIVDQSITPKDNPEGAWNYKGVFTAVWAYEKKKWVLMSWQHSDYKPGN